MMILDGRSSDSQMGQANNNQGFAPQPAHMQSNNQMNNQMNNQGYQQQSAQQGGFTP